MKRIADQIWDFNAHEYELIDFKKTSIYTKEFALVSVIDSFMENMVAESSENELQIDEGTPSPPIRKTFKSQKQKVAEKVSNQADGQPNIASTPPLVPPTGTDETNIPSSSHSVSQNQFSFDPPNIPCPIPSVPINSQVGSPTMTSHGSPNQTLDDSPITPSADSHVVQPHVPTHTIPTNQFPISFEWDNDIVTRSVDFFEKFDSHLSDIE